VLRGFRVFLLAHAEENSAGTRIRGTDIGVVRARRYK
jgi:hypothetical protein